MKYREYRHDWHPLFTERMAMEHMGRVRRWLHVRASRFHYQVSLVLFPDTATEPTRLFRAWSWLWRQYRRTWKR